MPQSDGERPLTQYDIVIIGGGPSGSVTAYLTAKQGLRVCLIDKANFPRDKLCGGLLTKRTKTLFERIFERKWDENIITEKDEMVMFSKNKFPEGITQSAPLYLTMRYDFDACLLDMAREAGADIRTGMKVSAFDLANTELTLASGERLSYGCLVGADGVNSQVAKLLYGESFNRETIGFALELEVPREDMPEQGDIVEIDMSPCDWGYGWTFPKKHSFTVGVGGQHRKNPDMKANLSRYMAGKGLDMRAYKVKGHFLSRGDFRNPPGRGRVILVGDAAGLGDPLTGEGICNAMQSAEAAARALVESLRDGHPNSVLQNYQRDYNEVTKTLKYARVLCWLIYPRKIRRYLASFYTGSGRLQRGYLDILSGELEYSALFALFAGQALRALKSLPLRLVGIRRG
ncbi:MAG TPA: geranylgeranyl reductase family protein [Rhizobiales bacterium]|nr:geranylgeranyl reductase family protein [Hyphomicrobiales bacterium]